MKYRCLLALLYCCALNVCGQNSMVGDGFGGRLWYKPSNYTTGSYSAYTLCGDTHQLFAWGDNGYAQFGDGTKVSSATPVKVKGMNLVKYYSTGYCMGVIRNDSSAWIWGDPLNSSPKKLLNAVKFLDAGNSSCSMIKYDGTVWSVGRNNTAVFGDSTKSVGLKVDSVPVQMKNVSSAVRVACGQYSTIVLLADGTLVGCGTNLFGTVGDSTTAQRYVPVKVKRLKNIVDVKANSFTNIALDNLGNVYSWGYGGYYCIGNGGGRSNAIIPEKITRLKDIVAISGCNDGFHFLALDKDQNCYGWGYNWFGSLGIGSRSYSDTPILLATGVMDIMAGERFSYILKNDGSLWATGSSKLASIWMNLTDTLRTKFTEISPTISPMYLCGADLLNSNVKFLTICKTDSLKVGSEFYKNSGVYYDTLRKSNGEDSVVLEVRLTVKTYVESDREFRICSGDTLIFNGKKYFESGEFYDTIYNQSGCDTLVELYIEKLRKDSSYTKLHICKNQQVWYKNRWLVSDSLYIDTLKNSIGCDSLVFISTIGDSLYNDTIQYKICDGDTLRFAGKEYSSAGIYADTLVSLSGCDSVCMRSVTVVPKTMVHVQIKICKGDSVLIGGKFQKNAGLFIANYTATNGCDSIVQATLELDSTIANFTPNLDLSPEIYFKNSSTNASQYQWTFGSGKDSSGMENPTHNYRNDTGVHRVCLTVRNDFNCVDSICKTIYISGFHVRLFNVFTPDGDGINDVFKIEYAGTFNYSMKIFNRWGELVYQVNDAAITDPSVLWNGNVMNTGASCPSGSYFFQFGIGKSINKADKIITGSVTLIRP